MKGLLVGLIVLFSGCGDWLDVNPRTEMKEEDMFQSEKGFQNVMNGVYLQMAAKELYGVNTGCYFQDLLAGYWNSISTSSREQYVMNYYYTYSSVENLIKTIWSQYYTCIANINDLLENLKKTDIHFSYGNKELLMGEAYGLRAFLHLEVLRLFGPVPTGATDATEAIPYVTELTRDPSLLLSLTYGEVKQHILDDLEEAEKYLKDDPFTLGSMVELEKTTTKLVEDDWQLYRQTHFNLYAVDALRARFYQWIGDKEQAAFYAMKVVEVMNPDGTVKFELANESNSYSGSRSNLVMKCEHLFALHCSNQQTLLEGVLNKKGTGTKLRLKQAWIKSIYENPEADCRAKTNRYFEVDGTSAYYLKFAATGSFTVMNMIPLIRVAEMYLILTESLPLAEAQTYFETYRQARGMDISVNFSSENGRRERVQKEYRKEFMGEGQMFFYYKRNNITSWTIPQKITVPANGLVVPKPEGQTMFE